MNNINYNDFINICRTCLCSCESKPIQQDNLIIEILHNLTGIHFETNDELPQQICLKCFDKINEIHAFAFQCKQSHFNLTKCLNTYKNLLLNQEQNFIETNEQIIIEDHKIKVENQEELKPIKENIIEELKIKQEILEDPNNETNEEKIPEINEFINVQNINYFQNDILIPNTSNIKVENEEKSDLPENTINKRMSKKIKNKQFKCDICGKIFIKKTSLKRHLKTHSGELPYQCDVCNKAFNSPSTLSNHKQTHSDERPFSCDVCGKAFKFSYVLIRHKRIHSGEPDHECSICTKTFRRYFDLKRHMRVHSGERPYKCFACNESFAYSSQLKKHKEIHEPPN